MYICMYICAVYRSGQGSYSAACFRISVWIWLVLRYMFGFWAEKVYVADIFLICILVLNISSPAGFSNIPEWFSVGYLSLLKVGICLNSAVLFYFRLSLYGIRTDCPLITDQLLYIDFNQYKHVMCQLYKKNTKACIKLVYCY
jgi:hypothetical protein